MALRQQPNGGGVLGVEDFEARLDAVYGRVAAACSRCGRDPDSVRLVAVTKGLGAEAVRMAVAAGVRVVGESRVQEAAQKKTSAPGGVEWHLVGHLQRNKVRMAVEIFDGIHSVDSLRLLEALQQACEAAGKTLRVFLEVNVSGEASKFGLRPEAVPPVLERGLSMVNVDVIGFMSVPPFHPDPEASRPFFRELRERRDAWCAMSGAECRELSMGMSGDFEVAVEEGATWIRVGTALFGPRGGQ